MNASLEALKKGVTDVLFFQDSLARLESVGVSIRGRIASPEAEEYEADFSPRIRVQAQRMGHVYYLFYCLENSVRDLIAQRLAEVHGSGWWDSKVPKKIRDNVVKLKAKEATQKYLASRSVSNIGYTFFGDLAQIIIACWADFEDLFPDQAWISSRFNDLEACRNIIMHTNALPQIEVDRISSIVRDWISQVG